MRRLQEHPWPGNVRELRLAVERAVVLAADNRLDLRHLAPRPASPPETSLAGEKLALTIDIELPFKDAKAALLDRFETRYWQRLLEASDGNITEAARRGGIHRKSLEYIIKKLDL
jgi:DNA-binding NtrC family response regulator